MGSNVVSVGVDIGSTTTKVVVLRGEMIASSWICPTSDLPRESAQAAYAEGLRIADLSEDQVDVLAATGYGRRLVGWDDAVIVTEIKACGVGVRTECAGEGIRTVIDVGGQDTKVLALDDEGEIEDFGMNDKCAAGTGRFLEMLAHKLNLTYEECVQEALQSTKLIHMNSTCAVFAESEVVGLLAKGESRADISWAAHESIAQRIRAMARRVGGRGAYAFVGGGARNRALQKAVEEALNTQVHIPALAQCITAHGAALVGATRYAIRREKGV